MVDDSIHTSTKLGDRFVGMQAREHVLQQAAYVRDHCFVKIKVAQASQLSTVRYEAMSGGGGQFNVLPGTNFAQRQRAPRPCGGQKKNLQRPFSPRLLGVMLRLKHMQKTFPCLNGHDRPSQEHLTVHHG